MPDEIIQSPVETDAMDEIFQALSQIGEVVENEEAEIEEFNKQYRALEADAKLNLEKIEKSQEKLRSVKTNKEYQSSLKEIEDIKAANSALEDQMLVFLEKIETAEKALKDRKQHYSEIVDESNQEKEAIKRDAEKREEKLAELESNRAAIAAELDAGLLKIYRSLNS